MPQNFGSIVGMSRDAFVLPNNIRSWAGRSVRSFFLDGTDAAARNVRPVKHKEEDCTEMSEVAVKFPALDPNATEVLSPLHSSEIYCMSAMFEHVSVI